MTLLFLLLSFFFLAALACNWLAGRFNAMMDTLKHHPAGSVFAAKAQKKKTVFGIDSQYWYNQNGLDWLAKYVDYDHTKGKRKWKILFFKIHIVQISDAWHWYKMWNVAMEKLDGVFIAAAALCFFIINGSILIIAIGLICYFWLAGIVWIVSFNKHYDDWLRV